jgi:hypothetical protein
VQPLGRDDIPETGDFSLPAREGSGSSSSGGDASSGVRAVQRGAVLAEAHIVLECSRAGAKSGGARANTVVRFSGRIVVL